MCFKGDRHTVSRNTIFDSSADATGALFMMEFDPSKPWAIPHENANSTLEYHAAGSHSARTLSTACGVHSSH
jgi:hypothetical protein